MDDHNVFANQKYPWGKQRARI